jgi:hypothetical protein
LFPLQPIAGSAVRISFDRFEHFEIIHHKACADVFAHISNVHEPIAQIKVYGLVILAVDGQPE